MVVINVEGLSKEFIDIDKMSVWNILTDKPIDKVTIFKNINFSLEKGSFLGILGKNGAGKSTLLKTIGGIYAPDKGSIRTKGKIVSIFELGSFYNLELTGERYCKDYLEFFGISKKQISQMLSDIKTFTELGDFFFQPIKTYSSGMQAKLLFSLVTSLTADIILIDEFLVVGDEYFQGKAWRRLKEFLVRGASGVMVSHDWVSLMKLTDQSMILDSEKGIEFIGETNKTVQKYLKTEFFKSDEVSFFEIEKILETKHEMQSGEIFNFSFKTKVSNSFKSHHFGVSFSIEKYEVGLGWFGVYNGVQEIAIVNDKNIYDINILVNQCHLNAGEYILALFLHEPIQKGKKSTDKVYEQLSWLNGKPIKMTVNDTNEPKTKAIFRKKALWQTIN